MIDLANIDEATLIARGKYSTTNGELKDERKRLQILTGELSSISSRVLRQMQPDNDVVPEPIGPLLEVGREKLLSIELCATNIMALVQQRQELKGPAWGRK